LITWIISGEIIGFHMSTECTKKPPRLLNKYITIGIRKRGQIWRDFRKTEAEMGQGWHNPIRVAWWWTERDMKGSGRDFF
jgi:hypothetical protein